MDHGFDDWDFDRVGVRLVDRIVLLDLILHWLFNHHWHMFLYRVHNLAFDWDSNLSDDWDCNGLTDVDIDRIRRWDRN